LLNAYNQLNSSVATLFPAPLLGNGQTLNAGIYAISGNSTINLNLTLDAQNNANAVFIFKIAGTLATNANAQVILLNGAKACNVYWKVEGQVSMAAGTKMKGNIIANNAAINITGSSLEGRALSTTGAISIDGSLAYTPVGCGSPLLTGPAAPALGNTACYALFSGNGSVTNTGNTYATGDVGTNVGLTTGFNNLNVTGTVHPIPDGSTGACASDLLNLYNTLNLITADIELLYPAQFGNSLVLTPHTYVMNSAVTFIDTLFLNAQGNANAVFVIQVNGALNTGTYAQVVLTNGTQAKNVFWKVDGALNIDNFSNFKGTVVCNNGAVNLNKGSKIAGRVLTTNGAFTTDSINVTMPAGCGSVGIPLHNSTSVANAASFYPNPFTNAMTVTINGATQNNSSELKIFNVLGSLVMTKIITETTTSIDGNFPAGVYFYCVTGKNNSVQSGKLISQQ
ncbi:MAG: ice-binding family protein, partial [Bacteroidia bacterium]